MNRIFILIHISMLLISCGVSKKKEDRTVFRYNSENGITSLDPAFASTQDNVWAVNQLFNGLVQLDSNLNPVPCIAKSWNISENGKIYTFTLHKDVVFHEAECFPKGTRKVVASDFVYSFERIRDPRTASPGAWIFNDKIAQDGFRALNDSILQIELIHPFSPFLGMLSMPYCMVVPKEAVEHYGKDFAQHPVGTGPFAFFLWERDVSLVLHKNGTYFEHLNGQRLPFLDAVEVSFVANKQMALLQFLEGKLDMFNGVSSTTKDVILDKQGNLQADKAQQIIMEKQAFLNTEYLAIYVDDEGVKYPWNNVHFRKAINYAIDRERMLSSLRNNIGRAAEGGFVPVGLPGHSEGENHHYTYDPDKAKTALNESEYLQNPVPITVSTSKDYLDLCIFIQKQLTDLGIQCEIDVLPASEVKEQKRNGNLNFFRASWIMDYPDAENYLSCFYSPNFAPGGPNYTHFHNDSFDRLYERALLEPNDSARIAMYKGMDQMILDEAPIVVLFYDQSVRLMQKHVHGLRNNPLNIPTLKYARIDSSIHSD